MKSIIEELQQLVSTYFLKLQQLEPNEWHYQSEPGKWTKKEILGHLIDSAANNHQRFVRSQYTKDLNFFYDQNIWVAKQNYKDADAGILINLWYNYNIHLLFIINCMRTEELNNIILIKDEKVTIEWVINDYMRHLKHHLNQITNFQ